MAGYVFATMTTSKVALITGVTGQDGSYLAQFLLEKGREVQGIKRRSNSFNTARVDLSLFELGCMSFAWMLINLVLTYSARKIGPTTCVVSTSWSRK